MSNVGTEQAAESQATEKSLGVFKTQKALSELFETASPDMSKAQLELMARATDFAQLQAENMAKIVEGFKDRCPQLLWQLSYQFDLIAGLIELGTNAEYRLNNPDKVYPPGKQTDTVGAEK